MLLLEHKPINECSHCNNLHLFKKDIVYSDCIYSLCAECRNTHYFKCKDCEDIYNREDCHKIEENAYCEDCHDKYYECEDCNSYFHKDDNEPYEYEDCTYCEDCYHEKYGMCEECEETIEFNDCQYEDGKYMCNDCHNQNYDECYECEGTYNREELYYNESNGNNYCENCYCEHSGEEFESSRMSNEGNTFLEIPQKREYGLELEISDNNIDYYEIQETTHFGSQEDCSISEGSEIVSPIMQGDIGYREIKKVCDIVKDCDTDGTTGYHLHIDYRDKCEDYKSIQKTWLLYNRVEKIL